FGFFLLFLMLNQIGEASVIYSSLLKGEKKLGGNTLSWSTASEVNCDFFMLEKSIDGIFFERVAILKAGGNSEIERKYYYTDSREESKRIFYRILQVDNDGTGAYSHAVILSDKPEDAPFHMEYVDNTTTRGDLVLSLECPSSGKLAYRLLTQLGEVKLRGEVALNAGSNLAQLDFNGVDVGTYQLALKVKNDIEVIAIRKVDSDQVPTIDLATKERK
ncbi:MAG: hypothetical protein AAGD05_16300, partial [Bacteroidota bacterium]